MKSLHLFRPVIASLTLVCSLSLFSCAGAVKSGAAVEDPFPKAMLRHKTFTVFKSGETSAWLGRVFRDEVDQILGEKMWGGKILASGGERREVEYDRRHAFALKAKMPYAKLKIGPEISNDIKFRLVLVGLSTSQLVSPAILSSFKDDSSRSGIPYVISILRANQVVMQMVDKTGAVIGLGAEYKQINVEARYEYSKRQKGLILAKNAIIGYMLMKPSQADLKRAPVEPNPADDTIADIQPPSEENAESHDLKVDVETPVEEPGEVKKETEKPAE